ncbi:lytic murein transglycosylase [Actinomadura viridis]|uniref:C40 family peptidase n=1 Tax=Actinomadura viridis TaxID=58110 RepID=UPI0036940805
MNSRSGRHQPLPQVADIPPRYLNLYRSAAAQYTVDWALLAAIGSAESDHGLNPETSSAGAQGPMQFMPDTWRTYGVDGNADGSKNIHDPADAIPAAARFLKDHGVATNRAKAIFAYNHANWYVRKVEGRAARYAAAARKAGLPAADRAAPGADTDDSADALSCPTLAQPTSSAGMPVAASDAISKVLAYAYAARGSMYSFGGDCTAPHSGAPARRCDCSSLVQQSYAQIKVHLPRTAHEQWLYGKTHGQVVPVSRAQPGDLVAFNSYLGPSTIGHIGLVVDGPRRLMINAPQTGQPVRVESYADRVTRPMFTILRLLRTS